MTSSLLEFDIIAAYFRRPPKQAAIVKSIGDDCAVLQVPEGYQLALSMDTLVAGRHFPESALPAQIARRAFCTCLSDLAAMGAKPAWFTLGLTLPQADRQWLEEFSQALLAMADHYGCELIGGDTTQGPMAITLQVHGYNKPGAVLARDAARADDSLYVTGTLGDAAAALGLVTGQAQHDNAAESAYLWDRFYQPEPQIAAGLLLTDYAHAAIDISDGLLADLQHIALASGVDIEVNAEKIPLSPACRSLAGEQALSFGLTGGDDYQLAFTAPQSRQQAIETLINNRQLTATEIGCVRPCAGLQPQVRCLLNGEPVVFNQPFGYQHFAP